MTFLIAAAGTGGHVFPGLAVGDALVDLGVPRREVLYIGGDRLEATVYPREGYKFLQLRLAGLKRSLAFDNLRLPGVVLKARGVIAGEIARTGIRVVLGMGGYVTIPAALAARKSRVPFFNAEQNAEAGLANKLTARWAEETFVSFPSTAGLPRGTWVGNPVRKPFWSFDRDALRPGALARYGLASQDPVVGVFGGSLGAKVINDQVSALAGSWSGPPLQIVHIVGATHLDEVQDRSAAPGVTWRRLGFEESMELFFAACDVVVARAGGAVAEVTATGTPSVLIPGHFGSGGHQERNAGFLADAGAAEVLNEEDIERLPDVVVRLIAEPDRRLAMAAATSRISKPQAARTIARRMMEATE